MPPESPAETIRRARMASNRYHNINKNHASETWSEDKGRNTENVHGYKLATKTPLTNALYYARGVAFGGGKLVSTC